MANTDIKNAARDNGVFLWQIADYLRMPDTSFSKKLRRELPNNEKEYIRSIIEKLKTSFT